MRVTLSEFGRFMAAAMLARRRSWRVAVAVPPRECREDRAAHPMCPVPAAGSLNQHDNIAGWHEGDPARRGQGHAAAAADHSHAETDRSDFRPAVSPLSARSAEAGP